MTRKCHKPAYPVLAMLVTVVGLMTGCATVATSTGETQDPLEPVNRSVYTFNDYLDRYIGKPVADGYVFVTPEFARLGVSNFLDNIRDVNVIVNDFLQGKVKQGFSDSGRFLVNSTFGLGGLFDHATPLGLPQHTEDFGQTLGVWGLGEGPYLMLPAFGPSTARDAPNLLISTFANVLFFVTGPVALSLSALGFIDKRARADQAIQTRDEMAVEPYLFTREAYLQHRRFLVYDGNPPLPEMNLEETYAEMMDDPVLLPDQDDQDSEMRRTVD